MPEQVVSTTTLSIAGRNVLVSKAVTESIDGVNIKSSNVAPGASSTLTTRTNNTAGTLTVASHSVSNSSRLFLFWSGGSCLVTVGTTSSTSIPFTGGIGDALPVADTVIQYCPAVLETFALGTPRAVSFRNVTEPTTAASFVLNDSGASIDTVLYKAPFVWSDAFPQADASEQFPTADGMYLGHAGLVTSALEICSVTD